MFSDRRDYLVEMIERVMQALAEQLRAALGADTQKLEALEQECERALDDEFAEFHRWVCGLTSRSAGEVVRPVSKLRDYAMLLGARALMHARRPDAGAAERTDTEALRALELLLEAALASGPKPLDRVLGPELCQLVGLDRLDPRYLEALVQLGEDQ